MFESLSDRLTGALQGLRGKGRLTDADIDATTREIRLALLEADVSLPVVRAFVHRIKERARGAEVSGALNPAQQVVKIVNEELIGILGGATRQPSRRPGSRRPVPSTSMSSSSTPPGASASTKS